MLYLALIMFINYRDSAGIHQCHFGPSGGAGAGADSQPLMSCRKRGWNPHIATWNDKGCLNLVPAGNRDESSKGCDCHWHKSSSSSRDGMSKMYRQHKISLAKSPSLLLPVPSHQRVLFFGSDSQAEAQGVALDVWVLLKGARSAEQHSLWVSV